MSGLGVHGRTGCPPTPPPKNAVTAWAAQPLKSLPITEWPVNGTTSSCASGISAATRRALEVGVRKSCAPERISVGTFGRAPGTDAAADASGQPAQAGIRLLSNAVRASNG